MLAQTRFHTVLTLPHRISFVFNSKETQQQWEGGIRDAFQKYVTFVFTCGCALWAFCPLATKQVSEFPTVTTRSERVQSIDEAKQIQKSIGESEQLDPKTVKSHLKDMENFYRDDNRTEW